LVDAIKAENKGDSAEAEKLRAEFDRQLGEIVDEFQKDVEAGKMEKAVKPPSEQALKEAMLIEMYPEMKVNNVGKFKREAWLEAMRTALVEDNQDDLIPEEVPVEEGEDAPLQVNEIE
jgi:hypothetical protein